MRKNYLPPVKCQRTVELLRNIFFGRSDIWLHIYWHYASNNMSNPNIFCIENLGTSNYFKTICIYHSNGRGFIQTIEWDWKGEFGCEGVYVNYFCPSLKCIYNIKSRTLISFHKKTNTKYFKPLCSLTFRYLIPGIKNSLLLALLTMQILWKEQILTETTFTKSSSDKVSNISMTDVRISFNVNPLTLPLLKKSTIEKLNSANIV